MVELREIRQIGAQAMRDLRPARGELVEPGGARFGLELEDGIEIGTDLAPGFSERGRSFHERYGMRPLRGRKLF